MKSFKKEELQTVTTYTLVFKSPSNDEKYSFICDVNGVIDEDGLSCNDKGNLHLCLNGTLGVEAGVIEKDVSSWMVPATGECNCGCVLSLKSHNVECPMCGQKYDMDGNELLTPQLHGRF
jgi:Zn finger protein HypA/HybF involved in hydrogenase expression